MSIFVSVAAYRDPELVPTVIDLFTKSADPDALRLAICWQHGDDESVLPFAEDERVTIIDVDAKLSRGACWARSEIQRLYAGEDYYLQLDSHHRFAYDWDARAIALMEAAPSDWPILSGWPTPYKPPGRLEREVYRLEFEQFTADGLPMPHSIEIPRGSQPVSGAFLAAGFLMAPGRFVTDVPYDPSLYFWGEEATLAARAFTHGYDIFYPPEILVWHEYTRTDKPRHWDDHTAWPERDDASRKRARRLLSEPWFDGYGLAYGLGRERTIAEWEALAGIDLANCCARVREEAA